MMIDCRTVLLVSSGIAALLANTPAVAAQETVAAATQTTEAAPAPEEQEGNGELIVVTAQKRPQILIDVPQSITVVSGATLENQQATNFQDYLKLVPGLQLDQSNPGEGRLILRGLNAGGVASTVAVYMDETPFGSSTGLVNGGVLAGDFDTFDVSRVEILRGPQGTLYGANSLGGLLKFVTTEPDLGRVSARGRVSLETTNGGDMSYRGHAVVNVPLGDTVAFRASGTYRKEGGFIDSTGDSFLTPLGTSVTSDDKKNINGAKSYGGRASLLFKPNDVFDVRLSASLQNIRTESPTVVESDPDTLESLHGGFTQARFAKPFGDLDYRVFNALLNYDLGFGTITSSTSFSKQNQTRRQDLTFNLSWLLQAITGVQNELVLDQETNNKRFTQEIRLASKDSDRFEWLIGGYYDHEDGLIFQEFLDFVPGTTTPVAFPPPFDVAFDPLAEVSLDSKYEEIAGFANATVHIGDRLHVDFGARYSHNDQKAEQNAAGALAGNVVIASNLKSDDNVFTYSVAPRYEFNDHASIYGRIAKGYRPGGPNVIPPNAPAGTPVTFDPDTVTSYEIGFKGESANRKFALDVAAYHIDWSNIQLFTVINGFGMNVNGSSADVDGIEFNATFRPVKGLNASINGAFTNARLADDVPPDPFGGIAALDGDRLPWTPKLSIGANVDYDWAVASNADAFVGASLRYLSNQVADFDADFRADNGHQRKADAYAVFDVRGGVDFGRFSVEGYAKNLFDSEGRISTTGITANGAPIYPLGAIGTGVIRPRTIGISLTAGL